MSESVRERTADSAASPLDPGDTEREDLADALSGLARVAIGAQPLEASLAGIARLAVLAIPGADGVGVAMLESGRTETVSVSEPFVRVIDDIQYGIGEGPCITAASDGRTITSGGLGDDATWPRFAPKARRAGVHSVVSLPLIFDGEVVGALNVYAHQRDAFTAHAARIGETFAVAAAVAVHTARVLMQANRLASQLQAALTTRAVIDQAIGIVCARQGCTAAEAFDRLRVLSQSGNTKLAVIAQTIVDDAVRRARARRSHG